MSAIAKQKKISAVLRSSPGKKVVPEGRTTVCCRHWRSFLLPTPLSAFAIRAYLHLYMSIVRFSFLFFCRFLQEEAPARRKGAGGAAGSGAGGGQVRVVCVALSYPLFGSVLGLVNRYVLVAAACFFSPVRGGCC